jgi:hypothetical protein
VPFVLTEELSGVNEEMGVKELVDNGVKLLSVELDTPDIGPEAPMALKLLLFGASPVPKVGTLAMDVDELVPVVSELGLVLEALGARPSEDVGALVVSPEIGVEELGPCRGDALAAVLGNSVVDCAKAVPFTVTVKPAETVTTDTPDTELDGLALVTELGSVSDDGVVPLEVEPLPGELSVGRDEEV